MPAGPGAVKPARGISFTMAPALVILAAGMGSRYGGDKHAAAVGPDDATISDYLIYDAIRAGFGAVVLVIRDGMQRQLDETICRRFQGRVAVSYAVQRLEDVPAVHRAPPSASRAKPWGTTHAVLTGARGLTVPFGAVNADDLYGPAAFARLASFLQQPPTADTHALVGFALQETLSPNGAVNRGVCRVNAAGMLDRIREVKGLERQDGGAAYRDEGGAVRVLPGDTPVSMNMWGFQPTVVGALERRFTAFLDRQGGDPAAECLLPATVEDLVRDGTIRVQVLTGPYTWWGITYPADRAVVARAIERLIASGVYPARLDA